MFKLRIKHLDAYLHEHPSLLGPVAMVTWSGQQPQIESEQPVLDFSKEDTLILFHVTYKQHLQNTLVNLRLQEGESNDDDLTLKKGVKNQ